MRKKIRSLRYIGEAESETNEFKEWKRQIMIKQRTEDGSVLEK